MSQLLSKSKYLNGLHCPKYLWIQIHEPERIPEPDTATQYIFDQGHVVGELAKQLFPDGIDIPTDDFMGNIRETQGLLEQSKPLFEAGIFAEGLYSRVDILNPAGEDQWELIEVKSTTSVKDINIHDASFQKHCCEKFGLKLSKCFLVYINNEYIREGQIDPRELFIMKDITTEVEECSKSIQDRVDKMFEIISDSKCPEVTIGSHCSDPYDCPLTECWDGLPEHNIFTLYYGGKKCHDLYSNGVVNIIDIPNSYKLNDKQQIQQACITSGEPHVDREAVRQFLSSLQYPIYYLDFETIGPAVPMFDGTRPYQVIPFQFSLHVVKSDGSNPEHFSFLASGTDDPRPAFLTELKKALGNAGSIVVYNQGFEEGILKELAQAFPEYDNWANQVRSRFVDLLAPFQKFHYYHPAQKGSASLKAVLPAITGRGYEDLDISDGQVASITFLAATYGDMTKDERTKVMSDLEKYCGRDTEGMIWIVDKLKELGD